MFNFNFIENNYNNTGRIFRFGNIKQLVIKSTTTPGLDINSINVEYINGEDVLYVNTEGGIARVFTSSCSGTLLDIDIVASDYVSGNCAAETLYAGNDNKLLEVTAASGIEDTFVLDGEIVKVLYYIW